MFRNIFYFLNFIRKADWKIFVWQIVLMLTNATNAAVNILFLKLIIDGIAAKKALPYIFGVVAVYTAAQLVNTATTLYVSIKRRNLCVMRAEKLLNATLLEKARQIDMDAFDNPEFFDKLQKAVSEADTRTSTLLQQLQTFLSSVTVVAVSIGIVSTLNPLFILVCAISSVIVYMFQINAVKQRFTFNEAVTPVTRRAAYFKGLFFMRTTIADLKQYPALGQLLFNKFAVALERKHELTRELNSNMLKNQIKAFSITAGTQTLFPYLYGGWAAYAGKITIGDITALANAFQNVVQAFAQISDVISNLKESGMMIGNLREILEYEPQIENQTGGLELRGEDIVTIEFSNISFKYPSSDLFTLRGVSFTINKGQKLALVGINGAGKTTLVKLLMRFYDPTEGAIKINGRDLREYDIRALRNAITSVFQEFQVYSLLLGELISCAESEGIDKARVQEALERVGLWDKVSEHSDGIAAEYTKYFNENGLIFSGGQVQKLIIARMLYKDSAVIVMDEPSSALDPESEYEINRDIARAAENKTVIMISHRLSTTKDADNIVLIENGEVQEQGTHAELIAKNGRYAYLFNIQASEYVEQL